jgi:hypothetical protein
VSTRLRNIRIPDDLWLAAREEAVRRNQTVTDAILRFLEWYAREIKTKQNGY